MDDNISLSVAIVVFACVMLGMHSCFEARHSAFLDDCYAGVEAGGRATYADCDQTADHKFRWH